MLIFKKVNNAKKFDRFMIHFGNGNYVPKFYFIHKYKNINSIVKNSSEFQMNWETYYRLIGSIKDHYRGFDTVVAVYLNHSEKNGESLGDFVKKYYHLVVKNNKLPFTINIENSSVLAFWEGDSHARYYTVSSIKYLKKYNYELGLKEFIQMIKLHRNELLRLFKEYGDVMHYTVSLMNQYLLINPHFIINTVWYGNNILIQISDYSSLTEYNVTHKLFPNGDGMSFDDVLKLRKTITNGSISKLVNPDTLREVSTGSEVKVHDKSLLQSVEGYNYYRV